LRNYLPGQGKINLVVSLTMLLIFLGLGYLFIGTNIWIDRYPKPNRVYIGLVLVGWSIFRGITVWMKYKRMKNENED